METVAECIERLEWWDVRENEIKTIFNKVNIDIEELKKNFKDLDTQRFLQEYICNNTDLRDTYQPREIKNYVESNTKNKYTLQDFHNDKISYDDLSEKQQEDLMYECYVIECITQDLIKDSCWFYKNILNHYNISYGDSKWDYGDKFDKVIECLDNDNRFN